LEEGAFLKKGKCHGHVDSVSPAEEQAVRVRQLRDQSAAVREGAADLAAQGFSASWPVTQVWESVEVEQLATRKWRAVFC
jgi:hypothetical protein